MKCIFLVKSDILPLCLSLSTAHLDCSREPLAEQRNCHHLCTSIKALCPLSLSPELPAVSASTRPPEQHTFVSSLLVAVDVDKGTNGNHSSLVGCCHFVLYNRQSRSVLATFFDSPSYLSWHGVHLIHFHFHVFACGLLWVSVKLTQYWTCFHRQ